MCGVFYARGKQAICALLNLSSYYCIGMFPFLFLLFYASLAYTLLTHISGIPLGMYLAFKLEMGIHGLWIGLIISLVYCSLLGTVLCLRTDWDHEVYKVMKRLAERDNALDGECVNEHQDDVHVTV